MMVRRMTDRQLATAFRNARNSARPLFVELNRRGFVVREKHGRHVVPMSTFENIIISKTPRTVKL